MTAELHIVQKDEPKSSPELIAIIRSLLEAAFDDEMVYVAVEYKFSDGRVNSYSVSTSPKS